MSGPASDPDATYRPSRRRGAESHQATAPIAVLTVLLHPDPSRVGERAWLPGLMAGGEVELSRLSPSFGARSRAHRGLADRALSRKPIRLTAGGDGSIMLSAPPPGVTLVVDGIAAAAPSRLTRDALGRGVLIELAERITVLLQLRPPPSEPAPDLVGILGESPAIARAREQAVAVAAVDVPVLVRGETGTGKELAARAIHEASPRRDQPFVAVNMGSLTPSLATSELFGHTRGAFSGAVADRAGFFVQADGGTLFLDEIGEAPVEVQVMLLRVLETGLVQPVGASSARRVDVRLVAATDSDLDQAVTSGRFRAPLYHRLAGYEIFLPPLRERIEDLGLLLFHFLARELEPLGARQRLQNDDPARAMWLGPPLMRRLARYSWPGNVRQLRNTARQLALSGHAHDQVRIDPALERLFDGDGARVTAEPAPSSTREPPARTELTEERVRAALEAHDHRLGRAAAALGIARNTLNAFIARSPSLKRPRDIGAGELDDALNAAAGDEAAAASALGISVRGLKLRRRELARKGDDG